MWSSTLARNCGDLRKNTLVDIRDEMQCDGMEVSVTDSNVDLSKKLIRGGMHIDLDATSDSAGSREDGDRAWHL